MIAQKVDDCSRFPTSVGILVRALDKPVFRGQVARFQGLSRGKEAVETALETNSRCHELKREDERCSSLRRSFVAHAIWG